MNVRRARVAPAAVTASIAFAVALGPSLARAQPAEGFNFCVAPVGPECVSDDAKDATEACDRQVEAYIATVFRYRQCLQQESERAIRESNEIIDHWRCRQRGERCRR